jgi:hypothetical protein
LINGSSGVSWVQPSRPFREDAQQVRTGNQPSAYAAVRNLATGTYRRAGFASIAYARRYYGVTTSASSPHTDTPENRHQAH